MLNKTLGIFVAGAVLAPGLALADDPDPDGYSWKDSRLQSEIGVSTILGGGITGFTDQTMRDATTRNVGGLWDLRVTIGSHTPLALDVGYVGTAADVNALAGAQSGTLVGSTFEGAVRYNILPHGSWNPYAFVGMGWQRYDITGADFTLSDAGMRDSDNSIVFPMGAGVSYRDRSGLVLDLRGTFRANTEQGLVLESIGSDSYAPMHSWEASAAAGYEF